MSQGFTKPPTVAGTSDPDAIHDNVSGEISALTEKATPASADLIIIEDSASSNVKKKVQVGNLPGGSSSPLTTKGDVYGYDTDDARVPIGSDGQVLTADSAQALGLKWATATSTDATAIHDNVDAEISAITAKASPTTSDYLLIEDAAASDAKKRITIGDLPTGSSPLTTKGDLHGYDTGDARLPVGTDNYVLTADSSQSLGIKWAAATTGGLDLTTKGQIHTHDSSADAALPVGSDGYVLTADSGETTGLKWADNVLEQAFNQDGTLSTGTGTTRWYTLSAKTIVSVHASVGVASSSGVVTVDVNKDGTTIFTTQTNRPEIAAAGYVSSSETPDVTTFASGSYLTVDIDAAGTDAENLVVVVRYKES